MNKGQGKNVIVLLLMFCVALLSRIIPHPPSFTGVSAFLIMGVALFNRTLLMGVLTLLVFFVSDLVLNNLIWASYYEGFVLFSPMFIYAAVAYLVIALTSHFTLRKLKFSNYLATAFLSAICFWLITNFGVWLSGISYPLTQEGLFACYIAGIPFMGLDLLSTLIFCGVYYAIHKFVLQSQWIGSLSQRRN